MSFKLAIICLVCGLIVGLALGVTVFKPDVNKAIVKQLKKDSKAVEAIEKKAEIRYVTREKIKTVIQKIPDISGCLDHPSPELRKQLLNALDH